MTFSDETDFVAALAQQRITLWSEGDAIRYRAPSGGLSDAVRREIAARRESLLVWLRRRGDGVEAAGPLSYAQTSHLLFHATTKDSAVAHVAMGLRLRGGFDHRAMRIALDTMVSRHSIMRTVYGSGPEGPVQRVMSNAKAGWELARVEERDLEAVIGAAYRRPFDLQRGPMLRAHVFEVAPDDHVVLVVVHHIAADAWSLWALVVQIEAAYAAHRSGREPPPLPMEATYLDFVAQQRDHLAGPSGRAAAEYWRTELAGCPHVLEIPADAVRPAVSRNRGASCSFVLDEGLMAGVSSFARAHQTTASVVLLAAWQSVLWRMSGQRDLVVGCPAAGREEARFATVVGDFVNVLPIRARFDDDVTFQGAVGRTRQRMLGAIAHQGYPFARIVDDLRVPRDPARHPLVQVMMVMQKAQQAADLVERRAGRSAAFADLEARPMAIAQQEGRFDLTLDIFETAHEWHCTLKYDCDVFEPASVARLGARLATFLRHALENPNLPLADVSLNTSDDERALTAFAARDEAEVPRDATVHSLLELQAARAPERIAVADGDRKMTYGELDARATQLARRLRASGVDVGVRVGVCIERSVDLVVGLLAVWKAGGVYVPLDPEYPLPRLEFMLTDSGASVLVTTEAMAERLAVAGRVVVSLDADDDTARFEPAEDVLPATSGTSVAYVMYTSGSTGEPKGSIVTHRAIQRLVWDRGLAPLDPSDAMAQAANSAFDAATFEIWAPLVHGARVEILPTATILSPDLLAETIVARGVTSMFLTPALFNQVARIRPAAFAPLRNLMLGGEAPNVSLVRAVLEAGPPRRLLNVYGPTEATTFASWQLVTEVAENATGIPIGGPLVRTQLHVLDEKRRPVPIGVRGELYIGGDGVARGYVNRPQLTQERFLPDTFRPAPPGEPPALLYRTGDFVRRLADGTVEFLGRTDAQVKIRGFRVELGEVEAALMRHDAIAQSVVVAVADEVSKRLVAYVAPRKGAALTIEGVRDFARQNLPAYMVPAAFVVLDALPLTINGKIDRSALPRPEAVVAPHRATLAAPSTEFERRVAEAWRDVLGPAAIGVDENFFDVGGDSIRMVQLHGRLHNIALREISIADLFNHPTIRAIADWLGNESGDAASPEPHERVRKGQDRLRARLEQRRADRRDEQ